MLWAGWIIIFFFILEGYFLQNRIIFDSVDKFCQFPTWLIHVGNWRKLVHRVKNYSVLEKITFQY